LHYGGEEILDTRLFDALDGAHLAYNRRDTPRGVPYAGFRWSQGIGESAVTAIVVDDVLLKLTAHAVNVSAEPVMRSKSAAKLPLGNVYVSPDDGQVEISLGLYIGNIASLSSVLLLLLSYLDEARCCVEGYPASPRIPRLSSILPRSGQDIIPLLIGDGHQPTPIENGAAIELKLQRQLKCRIEVRERPDAWLAVDARYLSAAHIAWGQKELSLLQRLQRWATAGRFVLDDSGELRAEVLTPNLGQPPQEIILWTISQSTAMLQVAAKHLNLGLEK
jgi:hypothetical protein